MKARVYIETTIISYLAARPSRDLIIAGISKYHMSGGSHLALTFQL